MPRGTKKHAELGNPPFYKFPRELHFHGGVWHRTVPHSPKRIGKKSQRIWQNGAEPPPAATTGVAVPTPVPAAMLAGARRLARPWVGMKLTSDALAVSTAAATLARAPRQAPPLAPVGSTAAAAMAARAPRAPLEFG
ncbi:hypothetical protein NL676_038291 [Syzygium grande]|nr:hypothetical protein NL676_038291 [Syzygium grande]